MREKLLDLMQSEGLKSSQLADMLGINPAGISHILAGRNKPGFDLLQKILRRFPRINPDWLILDSGPMYRDTEQLLPNPDKPDTSVRPSPVAPGNSRPADASGDLFAQHPDKPQAAAAHPAIPEQIREHAETAKSAAHTGSVERIVVFYDDHTFESYTPTKR